MQRVAENGDIIDLDDALKRVGGDIPILVAIADCSLEDIPANLTLLEKSISSRDLKEARRAAHSIKGLAANFSARNVVDAAFLVEDMAAKGSLDGIETAIAKLKQQLEQFLARLRQFTVEHNHQQ